MPKCFVWVGVLFWNFLNRAINCFWKIRGGPEKDLGMFYSSGLEKGRVEASAVVLLLLLFGIS